MTNEQLATDWTSPHRLTCDQLADALADNNVAKHIKRGYSNGEKVYDDILAEAARRLHGLQQHKLYMITRILSHYDHAREKHPYFCDRLTNPDVDREIDGILAVGRKCLEEEIEEGYVIANTVLGCEKTEMLVAIAHCDKTSAIEKAYDCIAVLLRIIDVLEGRQKLGKPEGGADA